MKSFLIFCLGLVLAACSGRDDPQDKSPDHSSDLHENVPGTFIDAYGDTVTLDKAPDRIISLAPNLTETVAFLGAEEKLVARTDYCDYPSSVQELPSVGTLGSYNYERIVALKPDLVLMMTFDGSSKGEYDRLKSLGVRPFALSEGSLPHVINEIDTIGALLGLISETKDKTDSLRQIISKVNEEAASHKEASVFVVIDKSPLMTTSGGFIGSVIEEAGGRNIAAGDPIAYPVYSRELLLRKNPDVILVPASSEEAIKDLLELYPEWGQLRAVRQGHIRTIPHNLIARPGPRIVEGLQQIARILEGAVSP